MAISKTRMMMIVTFNPASPLRRKKKRQKQIFVLHYNKYPWCAVAVYDFIVEYYIYLRQGLQAFVFRDK